MDMQSNSSVTGTTVFDSHFPNVGDGSRSRSWVIWSCTINMFRLQLFESVCAPKKNFPQTLSERHLLAMVKIYINIVY